MRKSTSDVVLRQYGAMRSYAPWLIKRPLGLFFYITGACNLNCTYCWQRDQDDNVRELHNSTLNPMNPDEWRQLVRNMPRPGFLGLSGGESTISPALEAIVDEAGGKIPITINTNGVTIHEKELAILTAPGVRNVSISLDGFAGVHDKSRNRTGLFEKIVENIKRFNALRRSMGRKAPKLTIKTVLQNETMDELEAFYDFCAHELKADAFNISFQKIDEHYQFSLLYQHDLDAVFNMSHSKLYDYSDHNKITALLEKLLQKGRKGHCETVIYPQMTSASQIRNFLSGDGRGVYEPCYQPSSMVVVLPDGEVIPCQSYGLGNVRDHDYSVLKVLQGAAYGEFCDRLAGYGSNLPDGCSVCCYSKVKD